MSDSIPVSHMQREGDDCMFSCQRPDAWSCSNLFTLQCGTGCTSNRSEERETKRIFKKEVETMKPKKGKGKGC